ncbi:MAG: ATP-binding protein [Lentimicrobium sp.]|jgi:signal transduction histidine kinase|nr:ATP-binding protein [Lentimicrobium sp.]
MGFKRFRLLVLIRTILIALTLLLLVHMLYQGNRGIIALIIGVLAVVEVAALIHYVERTNRQLTQFLESIRHSDFSTSFIDMGLGRSFEGLNRSFNEVIAQFKQNRAEKEEHYNYLLTVVQHVSIGMIAFRKDGKVDIYNNAVKRLLRINSLKQVSDLITIKDDLPELLLSMKAGDRQLFKLVIDNELLQLSVFATEFRMRGEEYILVSLQDISTELEEKEIESWQKLIRVLTHEIMNSITPISSLASTVQDLLIDNEEETLRLRQIEAEDVENIGAALDVIRLRSEGLLSFVETYRNLTRIPRPNFRYFKVRELFDRTHQLMKPKMERDGIDCIARIFPEDLMITADPDLIDQVMINLLLNAMHATRNVTHPEIVVTASVNANHRITINFSDNGEGIKPDILDKIFMPFFTSKKEGSGIGLSLSRQIMHLHKGNITAKSIPGQGSAFTLTF